MDEYVLRTVIGLDKSVALLGVEPLYCSASHRTYVPSNTTQPPSSIGGGSNLYTVRKAGPALYRELGNSDEPRGVDFNNISCLRSLYKVTVGGHGCRAAGGAAARLAAWPLAVGLGVDVALRPRLSRGRSRF